MNERTNASWADAVAHYDSRSSDPDCGHLSRFRDFVADIRSAEQASGLTAVISHDTLLISPYTTYPDWFEGRNLRLVPLPDGRVQINRHPARFDRDAGETWTVPVDEARERVVQLLAEL